MGRQGYLEGWSVMSKPTAVENRGSRGKVSGFTFRVNNNRGPALQLTAGKSVTKTNGLSLHPYWEGKPSCSVQWALRE
jgi:hypothetical protein